jgi:mRNA-degrading endonuclease RelE of RelBE toxin-antitoxin system
MRRRPRQRAEMRYRLELSEEALAQLRALPKEQRHRIGQKLDALQTDLTMVNLANDRKDVCRE